MNPKSFAIWFTGLSGSGKTTLCNAVATELRTRGIPLQILDGDDIRASLCSDLGFSMHERCENVRRLACVADLLVRSGTVVLVASISPLHTMRDIARRTVSSLIEVFVDAPLHVCEMRDPKGLYKRARAGELPDFTGIGSVYELPTTPDVICRTSQESVIDSTRKVVNFALAYRFERWGMADSPHAMRRSPPVIAVDFDGVIADYDGWHGRDVFGSPRRDVVHALTDLKAEGWKIIVHTTRREEDIVGYLRSAFIPFDEINRDGETDSAGCKPRATVYWDDRAVKYSGDARYDLDLIRNFTTWNGRL